jgi:hypothetical protein
MIVTAIPARRRWALLGARAGFVLSAAMLVVTVWSNLEARALPAGSTPTAGLAFETTSGDSSTTFNMSLQAGSNACPGDTASGGYRWQSFFVATSVDAGALTYNASGPIAPAGTAFVKPLRSSTNKLIVNEATAATTGNVQIGTYTYSFSALTFLPGGVPAGVYKVGVACTLSGDTKSFWQGFVTVSGNPTAFTWAFAATDSNATTTTQAATTTTTQAATTTTTQAATTTTQAPTTTTTVAATTTTVAGATTTVPGATTTTTVSGTTTTTAVAQTTTTVRTGSGGVVPTTVPTGSGGAIPSTGSSSSVPSAVFALLLLAFGRMAILLARPIKVIPIDER